ncbi:MAG: hypothetical protein IID61_09310, partial [SAR324 cluster bacterium]|nr:hypothetical protein [SAR324 cluster bacterium]
MAYGLILFSVILISGCSLLWVAPITGWLAPVIVLLLILSGCMEIDLGKKPPEETVNHGGGGTGGDGGTVGDGG